MDTPETLAGKRERAPVEGVMGSDTPTQSIEKRSWLVGRRLAFVMDKKVVTGHAQWWQPGMEDKIDSQTRMDPGAPSMMDGGGAVLRA